MPKTKPTVSNLSDLLSYDFSKYADIEKSLIQILPFWIQQAQSLKLKTILQRYLYYAEQHLKQLQSLMEERPATPFAKKDKTISFFIAQTKEKLMICVDPEIKDACLLASIQEMNHYKISMYGTATAFANVIGWKKGAKFFYAAEVSEKQIDKRLTDLAEIEVNTRAKAPFVLTA
jgi:ferritin-like metal-binding protein YciE